MFRRVSLCVFGASLVVLSGCFGEGGGQGGTAYVTEPVRTGSVVMTIAATGTIEPVELVDVGAQVSGQILSFGEDTDGQEIDYCSVVTNGMVLARIDDVTYLADLNVAKATLGRAKAEVVAAKAQLTQAEAELRNASRSWERATRIGVGDALSQSAYDDYQAEFEVASAGVDVATSQVLQAEAQVVEAQAGVEKAERNLGYCTISSPVNGVVIDRRVNLGQTVVSSMSASSLFLVAEDLSRLQIWVSVNEADIGGIKAGMPVSYTVDAFPDMTFTGVVRRVRLNAVMTSNVVTYTVEVDTENFDNMLLPYLTANVQFEVSRADGALTVPSRVLRWRPSGAGRIAAGEGEGMIYVLDDSGALTPRIVKVLLDNGRMAAVEGEGIREGMKAVEGVVSGAAAAEKPAEGDGENNPFMPNMPKPPRRGGH